MDTTKTTEAIEDPVIVPRGLLGAACHAIAHKQDSPKTLAKLRQFTHGALASARVPVGQEMRQALEALTRYAEDFYANAKVRGTEKVYENVAKLAEAGRAALASQAAPQEPVEYQYRMRGDWLDESAWGEWKKCSEGSYQDYKRTPHNHNWLYEVRKLYADSQPAPVPAVVAVDALVKKIATGYEGGTMTSDAEGLGGTITLHYESVSEAENAFDAITASIDATLATQPAQAPADRPLNITAADAEMLSNLMENPPEPSDAMKAAFAKFQADKVAPAGEPVATPDLYSIALTAMTTLRGCAATYIEDHGKDTYPGEVGLRPQDVAPTWAEEVRGIDIKAFLDEAIADAGAAPVANAGQPAGDERAKPDLSKFATGEEYKEALVDWMQGQHEKQERAAFEAYAKTMGYPMDGHGGHYSNIRTRNNWMGWQARAAIASQQKP